jgi:DNA-binding LytR/AlgR family response regulator
VIEYPSMQILSGKANNNTNVKGSGSFSLSTIINAKIIKGFSLGNLFWTAVFVCASHIFVDIRFEPYGFSVYPEDLKFVLATGYGLVLGIGFYLGHFVIKNDKLFWPVWKELMWVISMTIVITIINYFYRLFILHVVFDMAGIYQVSFFRYMLVGFEVVGSTAIVFKFFQTILVKSDLIAKYNNATGKKKEKVKPGQSQKKYKCVHGNNVDEALFFYPDDLLFVKSNGNYIQVFTKRPSSDNIEKNMIRLSMNGFEKQVENIPFLKRVHKSYIINEKHITKMYGNSKKPSLVLLEDMKIPLRRDLYKHYKTMLKQNNDKKNG